MSALERLERYAQDYSKEFPKLKGALRNFRSFVGNKQMKNNVARLLMFYISHARGSKTLRRSTRKRKPRIKNSTPRRSRRRTASTETEPTEEEAGAALFAAFIQAVADHGDSSDEDWCDEEEESTRPEWMVGPLMHVMLVGEPGTGKTTFAKLLVELWDAIELVDGDRYAKTTRADWIGKYQGHSTQKAKRLIEGNDVIFIDEAYSLVNGRDGDDMYGQEVLNEIVAAMTDEEKHTLFIFAGYKGDMEKLYAANRGLERRFGYVFELHKPSPAELFLILQKQLKKMKWKISKKERNTALEWFGQVATEFKFGGGSTQQFLFQAQQNAIERVFPDPCDRIITVQDMKYALKTCRNIAKKTQLVRHNNKKRRRKSLTSDIHCAAPERITKRVKRNSSAPKNSTHKKRVRKNVMNVKKIIEQRNSIIKSMYM